MLQWVLGVLNAWRLLCAIVYEPILLPLYVWNAEAPEIPFKYAHPGLKSMTPPSYTLVRWIGPGISYNVTPIELKTAFGPVIYNKTSNETWFIPPRNLHPSIHHIPIPTNRWWGNWIAYSENHTDVCAWANPYSICMEHRTIGIWYPPDRRVFGNFSGIGDSPQYYYHNISSDIILTAREVNRSSATPYQVVGWDDLSVTIRASWKNNSIESTFVSGMAFFTAKFNNLSPHLRINHTIVSINGVNATRGLYINDTSKLTLTLNNSQTWVVYTSSPIAWKLTTPIDLRAKPFVGHIRLAMAPHGSNGSEYDTYADCAVSGGRLEFAPNSYAFHWKTQGLCQNGLLHFGLQHHVDTIDKSTATQLEAPSLESSTRGRLFPFVTTNRTWVLREPELVPATFYPRIALTPERVIQANLTAQLKADLKSNWSMEINGSYYFNGKAAQKYASLCLMAADTNLMGNKTSFLSYCRKKLEIVLAPFINNTWTYELVYDGLYRGVVSSQGFAQNETYADFGNTMYNDHHYHYGYWITTAAIVNHVHPNWTRLPALNARVETLIRDVANSNKSDLNFPTFRSFDWYKGHSYSHGATAVTDGKDQESSSEDINFHYGLTLYGMVTKRKEYENLGRLMLSVNARAARTYFLMEDNSTVQNARMRPNKVLGIIFDNKVNYTTWFSNETYCIHGIQMIPTTPVTEYVRSKTFVKEEWDQVISTLPIVTNVTESLNNTWSSIIYLNYARVDPDTAISKLKKVPMDDGLTRAWALYMAASQGD
ncbi:endo-1,3(4)-beta-glucanase [Thraustotheca clavata]|uniref:glucan endo-1,3-beta-D-glucosidase n=1 Tax=Thraustotheca clavata TaxID=74557 RepID=A0A1V9ZR34_9STRA|nr:endo-1,3(4)-beta-glucanase [Thraustotheca clavata]